MCLRILASIFFSLSTCIDLFSEHSYHFSHSNVWMCVDSCVFIKSKRWFSIPVETKIIDTHMRKISMALGHCSENRKKNTEYICKRIAYYELFVCTKHTTHVNWFAISIFRPQQWRTKMSLICHQKLYRITGLKVGCRKFVAIFNKKKWEKIHWRPISLIFKHWRPWFASFALYKN